MVAYFIPLLILKIYSNIGSAVCKDRGPTCSSEKETLQDGAKNQRPHLGKCPKTLFVYRLIL